MAKREQYEWTEADELKLDAAASRQEQEDYEHDLARVRRGKSWFPSTEQIFEAVAGTGPMIILLIQLALVGYVVFHFVAKYW